jgi:chloramphenicol-sensitive protein RarD
VFLFLLLALRRQLSTIRILASDKKIFLMLMLSSCLIACNWLIFIWAVNNGMIIEASLGYYINPLVNILLGVVFLKERPTRGQSVAIVLAFAAVMFEVYALGSLPLVSLSLALLFGFYGLVRKKVAIPSLPGLYIETLLLFPLAMLYWGVLTYNSESAFAWSWSSSTMWLLMLAGPVTVAPLLAFTSAAGRLRLGTLGYFQYIAPSINLLLAIIVYNEPLTKEKLITFSLIWTALIIVSIESYRKRTRKKED